MNKKQQWLEKGYSPIAEYGLNGVSVEFLAKKLGTSKSSFYHYFGNFDYFVSELLDFHLERAAARGLEIAACESMLEVVPIFLLNQDDILFNKQLRINRDKVEFSNYSKKAYQKVEVAMLDKWSTYLNLEDHTLFAQAFLQLIADNFLLQITKQNFNQDWILEYLKSVEYILIQMRAVIKK